MTTSFTPSAGSDRSTSSAPFHLLRDALSGTLRTPDDEGWDDARSPWLLAVDQHPAAVAYPVSEQDATEIVRFAARHGLRVAAQQRGHGATGSAEGAILVRTGAFDAIEVDAARRVARVGAGVRWGALLAALDGTGLVGLPGSNPDVSVVGYCLGGGLSWFSRAFGTGASALRAVELVDAAGDRQRITPDDDPDLLWALRGGGGDFGLVTAVEIDLFDAPEIYGGRLVFPGVAAAPVLHAFADRTRSAPDELTLWATLMHFPDVPFVPAEVRGQSFALVDVMFVGTAAAAEELIAPLRAAGPVVRETVRPLRPSEIGGVAEEPEDAMPALVEARSLTGVDDATIDRLLAVAGPGSGTPLMMVQIRQLGGALRTADADAGTAVRFDAPYLLTAIGGTPVPTLVQAVRAGLDAVLAAIEPAVAARAVLTFLAPGASIDDAYGAAAADRLRSIKRSVDPGGVFRSNFPVLG